jgi:hypothetical protein
MDHAPVSDADAVNGHAYSSFVHQASGMVGVQSRRLPDAGLALIIAYAAMNERGVEAVARDVIAHRLRFDESGGAHSDAGIEPA